MEEKTIPATPRRREQARQQGHVPQSAELASAGMLLVGVAVLLGLGGRLVGFFSDLAQRQLGGDAWVSLDAGLAVNRWNSLLLELGYVLAPVLALLLVGAVAMHVLQTGPLWNPERLLPDASRINPLSGFKRIFSPTGGVRLTIGLLRLVVVSLVACWSLSERRNEIVDVATLEPGQIAALLADIVLSVSLRIGLALLGLAAIDYAYQRWKHERDLRMTPQELREELKNLRGDPQLRTKRRELSRRMSLDRIEPNSKL